MTDREAIDQAICFLRNGQVDPAIRVLELQTMPLETVDEETGAVTLASEGWEVDENVATNIDGEAAEIWSGGGEDVVDRIVEATRAHLYDAYRVGMVRRV